VAIYGFARLVDDIGDEAEGDRLALLERAEKQLHLGFSGTATHPVFRELGNTIVACGLEQQPLLDLFEANRQDQRVGRYETFEELRGYCRLSADPVGRLVLAVTGSLTAERAAWSDDVCTGLQLVEHWQDVGEDARRGRVYLPQEDLRAFGVSENDLLAPGASPQLKKLIAFECDRARGLLGAGRPLVNSLHGRVRVAVGGFAAGGLAALDAIEAADYDVIGRPARGTKGRLLVHSLRLLLRSGGQA
jgi:squalene synthase HpnC